MKLTFRCHPALAPHLPRPVAARAAPPAWLRSMPRTAFSAVAGAEVRTLKQCPPFIDALGAGALLPLAADLEVADGEFRWNSDFPPVEGVDRSPIGAHVPEQAAGCPLFPGDAFILKFMNFWALTAPEGWSVLFCHPFNRTDLPFHTLGGVVDCDRFALGLVHFPALWTDPGFRGVLPKGTPVAQCVPIRREALEIDCGTLTDDEVLSQRALRAALGAEAGVYRRLRKPAR